MPVPTKWQFLQRHPLPSISVLVALDNHGLHEGLGEKNNPTILAWADEVGKAQGTAYANWAADFYNKDSIPWCGLFMAWCQTKAVGQNPARLPLPGYLAALSWAAYGSAVPFRDKHGKMDLSAIEVGDIAVMVRDGGGHVTHIVAVSSDGRTFFGLGGNQNDQVSITEFSAERLYAVRRPPYVIKPQGSRHVLMGSSGVIGAKES
jgi:uncharacterized protein (TIGR02594 family)